MLEMTITVIGMLAIMWVASELISRKILNYLTPKLHLEKQTQKEIKCLVSSIVTLLTGLFSALYLLLSR